ncbi:MAG: hypothetical protein IJE43_18620 [Alphaproteobacteria bacterium]|nr:hypothetical protein [Alphaproteobacteria bacterium]
MTDKKFNKDEMQTLVLEQIMSRPYHDFSGNKIHYVAEEYEAIFVKNLKGNKEVHNLSELEEAVNSPEVKTIFIGRSAAITSRGLENVLSRTSLIKQIFCAFKIK